MSSFKKFILGEKMPDKDDPKYKDRYEKEVNAGMKFAKAAKIDKIAISVQSFANAHRKLFLAIVFGVVLSCGKHSGPIKKWSERKNPIINRDKQESSE